MAYCIRWKNNFLNNELRRFDKLSDRYQFSA